MPNTNYNIRLEIEWNTARSLPRKEKKKEKK